MNRDIDYDALFGVDKGEEGQEIADPAEATDGGAEGGEEQEIADPAGMDESGEEAGDGEGTETDAEDGEGTPGSQSKAERARFAAARRKAEAERDAAVKAAKEEAQRQIDAAISSLGIENPYTGKTVRTKEEYDQYVAAVQTERKNQLLKRSGMSEAEYKEFVDGLPEVQAARAAKAQADEAAREAAEASARQKVEEQLAQIRAMDPSVKSLADLAKTENYPKVYEMVKKGYDLADAYKLANFDRVQRSTADSSRQAAMNAAAGKAHMSSTASRGVGAVSVPSDVADMYRVFDPDISDAEIQKHYARYAKK